MAMLLFFLLGAILVSFVCSLLESTLMSTPMSYIAMLETSPETSGMAADSVARFRTYKQNPSRPLAAILSLNTIANTIGAAGVGRQATMLFGSAWFGVVSAITTILILVVSEIIPKTIGTSYWKSFIGFTSNSIRVLVFLLYPVVICIEKIQMAITPRAGDVSISREEIGAMADVAEETGELEGEENEIIQNIINIDELTAKQAMTPRVVAATAPESMKIKQFYKDRRYRHHSRIPVYSDDDDYITGYILRMDALQLMAEDKFDSTLGEIRRKISSFPEDTPIDHIWNEMIRSKEQIAVVIDEYGAFLGIITMEDIIETILGDEIVDERDSIVDMQQLAKEKRDRIAGKGRIIGKRTSKQHN